MSDEYPPRLDQESPVDVEAIDAEARYKMRRLSRKSFLWAGVAVLGGYCGLKFLDSQRSVQGALWPFRVAFEANEQLQRDLYRPALAPTFDPALATEPTVNLLDEEQQQEDIDIAEWRLSVEGLFGQDEPLKLSMDQLKKLPRVEQTTNLNCVEGWTTIVHWAGIRFADLAEHLGPATQSGEKPDVLKKPGDVLEYVALETVEKLYYVSVDTLSALHPQTLLAYEMNGKPLTTEHGFPLRLVIPTKYGIKNIKRIGSIKFSAERPKDYWAEQGYDWYAGL